MSLKHKIKDLAVLSIPPVVLSFLFISNAWTDFSFAQNQAASGNDCCWIDVKTGKQVNTIPGGCLYVDEGRLRSGYTWGDHNSAYNPKTGRNFAREPDGCWIDVKTGKQVNTIPGGCLYVDEGRLRSGYTWGDHNSAYNPKTGRNFARVPCPPPAKPVPPPATNPVASGYTAQNHCDVGDEGGCSPNPCGETQECQMISKKSNGASYDCHLCKEKPKTATGVPPTNATPVNPGTNGKPSACLVGQEGNCASNSCPSGQECQTISSTKKGAAVDCYICKEKPKTATGVLTIPTNVQIPSITGYTPKSFDAVHTHPMIIPSVQIGSSNAPLTQTPATNVQIWPTGTNGFTPTVSGTNNATETVTITNQLTGEKYFLVIEHPYERNVLNRAGDPTVFAPASVMALAKVVPSTGMIPNVNGVLKKITDFMGSLNAGFGPAGITTTGTLSGAQLTNALKSSLSSGGSYGSSCFDGVQQQADKEAGGKSEQAVSEDQIKTSEDAGAPAVSGPMVSCGTQNGNKVLKVYAADGQLIDSITQDMLKSDPNIILKELGIAQNSTDKLMLKTNNVKPPMDQALAQKQNQEPNAGPVVPNDPLYQLPAKKKRTGIFAILGGEAPTGPHPELDVKDQYYLRVIGYTPLSDPNSAWNVVDATQKNVVVAIVDSGLDLSHPDGPQYLWTNPVDGSHGWNFVDENTDLTDFRGHGTFVAGIIAAKWNNGIGIAGINPGAVIMPIKVTDDKGRTDSFAVYRGINFAVNHGAKIINLSIGGRIISKLEQQAIESANARGVLVVIAAGNYNESLMTFGPASSKYALAVGMVDFDGQRSQVSNWGPNLQVVAPGEQIWSLCSKDTKVALPSVRKYGYYKLSGTSFSAPMVTATASLIWAKDPQLTSQQVADIIRATATPMKNTGWNDRTGFGLLNAGAALRAAAGDQLIAMITNMHFNRDVRGRLTSLDIYGTVRGPFKEFTIEAGRGKMPLGFRKIAGPFQGQYNYQLIARLVIHDVLRGSDEWVLRLRVIDDQGKAHDASTSFNLPGK